MLFCGINDSLVIPVIIVRIWIPYGYDRDNESADLVDVPMVNRLN